MNFPNSNQNPRDPYNSQNPLNSGANPFDNTTYTIPVAMLSVEERLDFIRKTYSLFMAGIVCSLLVGALTLNVDSMMMAASALWANPLLGIVLLFGLSIGAGAISRIEGLNYVGLFGFTAFIGFWITPLLFNYERSFPGLVSQAGILTTLAFGALTAYAFISKKDFSFLGGMLFIGLIALIGGGLLNVLIFKSLAASYWMAWVTVVVFSGYVLYDTSNIMRTHDSRSYVSAALGLFINFLNMFLAILRILAGGRRD